MLNKILIPLLFFFTINVYCQDKLFLDSGENIECKIIEINIDNLKYKKFSNIEGPTYTILKSDIHMVLYSNGESEIFENTKNNSSKLSNTRKQLLKYMNNYCYSYENGKPIQISFERDFLRIRLTNREKSLFVYDKGIYDFSSVYRFERISFRDNQIAFLNIWVSNKRYNRWNKVKLVIKVRGHDNANKIIDALKDYNKLMLEKK